MTENHISPEDFVRAWQESSNTREVADRLGITTRAAAARAGKYRRRGVALKKMRPSTTRLDVAALNALARATCPAQPL